jgi:hypothetical protein
MTESTLLSIETATWHRDSHGLFDYESKNVTKNQFSLSEPAFITRAQN